MKVWRKISNRFNALFRNGRAEAELNDELQFHLEMEIEKNLGRGMSPSEAKRAAKIALGGVEQVKEDCRDSWGVRVVSDLWRDVRFGLRQMLKRKVFAAVSLLTLIICMCANTTIFSLVHAFLIRPYDFPEVDRIVGIGMRWKGMGNDDGVYNFSPRRYLDVEKAAMFYESIGFASDAEKADLRVSNRIQRVDYGRATPGVWEVTRAQPIMGRLYTDEDIEKGDTKQIVLSYWLWQDLFDGKSSVIGESVALDDEKFTVTAVLPKSFSLRMANFWIPKVFSDFDRSEKGRRNNAYIVIARLKPEKSLFHAQQELDSIYAAHLDESPEHRERGEDEDYGAVLLGDQLSSMVPVANTMLWSMQFAVAVILLIGVLNISSLVLVRNYYRLSELAMRHSLGAGKGRIMRQLTTETVLLFVIGGVLSLPVASWILAVLGRMGLDQFPVGTLNRLNSTVLGVSFLALFCFGIVFGLLPAWSVLKKGIHNSVLGGSRSVTVGSRVRWLQNCFVIGQISLSVVLLVATGALLKNVRHLSIQELGYSTEDRFVAETHFPAYRYRDARAQIDPIRNRILEGLRRLPGVFGAAYTGHRPMELDYSSASSFEIEGLDAGSMDPDFNGPHYRVSPGYFETMGIEVLHGRDFSMLDTEGNELVAVVSRRVQEDCESVGGALGRSLLYLGKKYKIIGVVEDSKDWPFLMKEPRHSYYFSAYQWGRYDGAASFVIHSGLPSSALESSVRKIFMDADPDLSEFTFRSMEDIESSGMMAHRMPANVLVWIAGLAIALSSLGLYGVVAYAVSERSKEFGIRAALGEAPGSMMKRVFGWGGRLAAAGLSLGLVGAYFLARLLSSVLPNVNTTALGTFIVTGLLVIIVTLFAVAIPARRAARSNPMQILRAE